MPLSLEELRERARPWTEPISDSAPAGGSAKHEPAYETVALEVARLESPTGTPVSWNKVVANAGELLQRSTKDLWLASYLAYGLHATEGLRGTVTGVTVLSEVLERYWPTLFPEPTRLRGRVNAVGWFAARMAAALPAVQVTTVDRELLESLETATRRLADVSRTHFADQGPALGPLLKGVERLRSRLPAAPVQAPAVTATPPSPPPPLPLPALGPSSGGTSTLDQVRNIGTALLESAQALRKANTAEPLAYRLLRTGLWIHLLQAPPVGPEGRTLIPALPSSLRERLDRLETHARWPELLEEAEAAMSQYRFVLDLQRYSAAALTGLGPTHALARDVVRQELAALVKRMPTVVELLAADATPLADARTRQWMEAEVLERPAPAAVLLGPAAAQPPQERHGAWPEEVRELLAAHQLPAAVTRMEHHVATATTGRTRFHARLGLARLCVFSGQHRVSQALYETLVAESTTRGLDEWEPSLSVECLEGILWVGRIVQKNTGTPAPESWSHFRRLTLLDPSASLRLGQ